MYTSVVFTLLVVNHNMVVRSGIEGLMVGVYWVMVFVHVCSIIFKSSQSFV